MKILGINYAFELSLFPFTENYFFQMETLKKKKHC